MNNRTRTYLSRTLLAGASAIAIASAATPAAAQDATRAFDIPAQPLSSALIAYSQQSDTPVIASMDLLKGKAAPAVRGDMPQQLALSMLLEGSGLRAVQGASGGLVVERVSQTPQGGSASGGGATVEALIVTAQKREEDIQDVPIAISAFSQEDLTRSQVAGGPDLMTQVPNMTFTKTNFSSYSIQLRGIGTQAISATVDPAVAVAFNNTPFVRNRFFEQEFYDLQRVEVLRGPQGTLYGRNATAGVVNIISAKPKFLHEAKASADIANYNSSRLEGMVNVPLVEDAVALRIAGAWTKRNGYATNALTGNSIDGRDLWSTRLSLRIAPTDRLDANLIWEHFEEDDDRIRSGKQLCHKDLVTDIAGIPVSPLGGGLGSDQANFSQGCVPASLYSPDSYETANGFMLPYYYPLSAIGLPVAQCGSSACPEPYANNFQYRDLRVIESTVEPSYKAKSDVVELQFTYDLSDTLSLSSETAWASDFIFSTQDYNRYATLPGRWRQTDQFQGGRPGVLVDGVFCDPQFGCSDRLLAADLSTARSRHFSQEFRLASNYDGPFNFSVGGNYLRYDTYEKYYVFINSLSLYSATRFASLLGIPYEGGVSDNLECLPRGLEPQDPTSVGLIRVTTGNCVYMDPNPIDSLNDLGHNYFLSNNPYKLISYAAFGEAYYNFTENLKLTLGLRWTVDKKEAPRIPSWIIAANAVGYPVYDVIEQEWREPTGRIALDWKPDLAFTDETLLYGSFARGYKAGGANPPPASVVLNANRLTEGAPRASESAVHPTTFGAEYVNAFELGAKNTLLDGSVTLNLAGFYYDYQGYQLSQIVNRSAITQNFDADLWGLELEADWRPAENLRFGLKLGYANTEVGDGMKAVDVMDRANGGLPDERGIRWMVLRPFPTDPSNCVYPIDLIAYQAQGQSGPAVHLPGTLASGNYDGGCERLYAFGQDPFTNLPYVPNPTQFVSPLGTPPPIGYEGFNPAWAPNNGEGFDKDLSGNELPNAPHYTATLTADYTVPLAGDWLATLHTDLYYQSEAWTRIFNTEGYDKLKAYSNVNLAAIFTNEDAGWKVMAYVKNVFDRDSITGAFLNSDDSGLTTNVFLTEPRLYGLRVTKEWSGGPWWTGAGRGGEGPWPLTVAIGGTVQYIDAPTETVSPSFMGQFPDPLNTLDSTQHRDFDTGDEREIRLSYRPEGSKWAVSTGVRYGRVNKDTAREHAGVPSESGCAYPDWHPGFMYCGPEYEDDPFWDGVNYSATNWSDTSAKVREKHTIVDFQVGRDMGMGLLNDGHSTIAAGLRYGHFNSDADIMTQGVPNWVIPNGWFFARFAPAYFPQYLPYHTRYEADLRAEREFSGIGPAISWDAAKRLFGDDMAGRVNVDWAVSAGVLFGKQKTDITGEERYGFFKDQYQPEGVVLFPGDGLIPEAINVSREDDVTVPVVDISLGLSYEIQRVKLSAGYRWERYFDVLDVGGTEEAKQADRTIDGPYFKISVGFGG